MRIALFSGNYNYQRDGANQALNRWVGYLLARGAEVRVYSPVGPRPAFAPTGTLVPVPSLPIPGRSEYRLGLGMNRAIEQDVARFAPDLVHLSAPDVLGAAAQRWARAHEIPCVASVHTRFETYLRYYRLGILEPLAVAWLRRFYGRCRQIYAPSVSMVAMLEAQGIEGDIRLWRRGVDSTVFRPSRRSAEWRRAQGIGEHETVVLFVGRLVHEKGLDRVAATRAALAAAGVEPRWLVVGDGPARAAFEAAMPGAVFTGFLTGDELATAYASADIFFNPSMTETFGNVTLEAMASGLPVVAAPATGSRSLVHHERTGFIARRNLAADYALWLARLIGEPGLRQALGREALGEALRYDWEAIMAELEGHYAELIGAASASPNPWPAHSEVAA